MTADSPRSPNWWDDLDEPLIQPTVAGDHLLIASDRLALAVIVQTTSGGDLAIAGRLSTWCLDLKRRDIDLATALAILQNLDRLDRHACEPQTWEHLRAAEMAVAAYVAKVRGG